VQQSNYLWSIADKKQIAVEGIETVYNENNYSATFTEDGKYLFYMNGKLQVTIINVNEKKIVYGTERGARATAVSKDNQFYAFHGAVNTVRTYRLTWTPSSVGTEPESSPQIMVSPLPGQENIRIEVQTPHPYSECHIWIASSTGAFVHEIFKGSIALGKQLYIFPTTGISSGQYSAVMSYSGKTTSVPFIITK